MVLFFSSSFFGGNKEKYCFLYIHFLYYVHGEMEPDGDIWLKTIVQSRVAQKKFGGAR